MSRIDHSRLLDDDDFDPAAAASSSRAGRRGNFSESTGDGAESGPLAAVKGWWEDPKKRRWIIGGSVGVLSFILIISIAAVIARDRREEGGAAVVGRSSSSTGGAPAPPSDGSTGSVIPYNPETPWLFPRLPNSSVPVHYDLVETIDLAGAAFWGTVNISLRITRPTDHIVLHALNLLCSDVSLRLDDGSIVTPAAVWNYTQNRRSGNAYLVLNFSTWLQPQQSAVLNIAFRGRLVFGSGVGLFSTAYLDPKGQLRLLASTEFEAADARRAFPCFDEPALKATFSITVINSAQYPTVLSNMPGATTTLPSGWLRTSFGQSPVMSTYLVAITVSDYLNTAERAQCGSKSVETRVFAPPHLLNWTTIAAKIAAAQMQHYCEYFNSTYPLPKEDHFPVLWFDEEDAMENWGLITYDAGIILLDPDNYDVEQLELCAVVIAHELAHQWFGNVVTAAWWSQLWLNEGFATFVEYIGAERSNPELRMQDQFISIAQATALYYDAEANALPVEDYNTPTGNFDVPDYDKGGSLLRMLEAILGKSVFLQGIRDYLQQYAYGNAYSKDLFQCLTRAAGGAVDVSDVMQQWVLEPGFPLVNCSASRQSDGSSLWRCSQQRFMEFDEASPTNTSWTIWLTGSTFTTDTSPFPLWWRSGQASISFTVPQSSPFVKLNLNNTGYFRVAYDPASLNALAAGLNTPGFSGLTADDRLGLVEDAYALWESGLLSFPLYFNLTRFLSLETDWVVWQEAADTVTALYPWIARLRDNDTAQLYARYAAAQMDLVARSLDFSAQQAVRQQWLQPILYRPLVWWDIGSRSAELLTIFTDVVTKRRTLSQVPANLIDVVLATGCARDEERGWRFVRDLYELMINRSRSGPSNPDDNDNLAPLSFYQIIVSSHAQDHAQLLTEPGCPPLSCRSLPAVSAVQAAWSFAGYEGRQQLLGCAGASSCMRTADRFNGMVLVARQPFGLEHYNAWVQEPGVFPRLNQTLPELYLSALLLQTLSLNNLRDDAAHMYSFYQRQSVSVRVWRAVVAGFRQAQEEIAYATEEFPQVKQALQSMGSGSLRLTAGTAVH